MNKAHKYLLLILLSGAVHARESAPCGAAEQPIPSKVEFNRDIRPILSDVCFQCHGPDKAKRKAKLRFDTEEGAFADLGGRFALVAGDLAKSEMYHRITTQDEKEQMPPPKAGRKLTTREIEIIRRWIEQGGKYQKHWALIAPVRPLTPTRNLRFSPKRRGSWARNAIDAFVLDRLEKEGLSPSPEAPKTTLIRRVTLDLTGLPPTPAEVDAFLADNSPEAYEKVVDRLLASPRYGERMVLEWLDAARYADSNGYQSDRNRTLWPWRDWVIDAINKNMPFDQFTVEMLAGDLLPSASVSQKVATGFNRNHMLNGEGGRIAEESRVDYVVDRVDTTMTVWQGLTFGCARCHDHKYDTFSQKEYYQLYAYFNHLPESGSVDRGGNATPVIGLPTPEQSARMELLSKTVAELEQNAQGVQKTAPNPDDTKRLVLAGLVRQPALSGILAASGNRFRESLPDLKKFADSKKALDDVKKSVLETMVMEDRPQPRDSFILIRGAYDKYGEKVSPNVPANLPSLPPSAPSNRLGLANWLVDAANPLTARVTVNRQWQMFFGTGLVKTTEDFGVQGELPSHTELLDWLASEFMDPAPPNRSAPAGPPLTPAGKTPKNPPLVTWGKGGWDVKALHRLIVTSATYRQSSRIPPELRERDPDNRLLARGPRQRLSSFAIRDQALALGGLLVEKLGGPPVQPYQPPGIWEEMTFGFIKYQQDKGEKLYRRSLYTFWRRTVSPTTMFDTSARQVCTVRQSRTNTPLQSLILLNDVTYVEAARKMAERVMTAGGSTPEDRINFAFRLATARPPNETERQILLNSFQRTRQHYQANQEAALKLLTTGESPRNSKLDVAELAAYTGVASMILNLDEVITKE